MSTRNSSCTASSWPRSAGAHALGGEPRAQRFELGHRLEHAEQALLARPRHHRAAMGAHLDQAAGGELADGLAHRRARHAEAARQLGLVEAAPGAMRPRTISSASASRSSSARVRRPRPTDGVARAALARSTSVIGRPSQVQADGPRLVDHADMRRDDAPALGEADPGLHLTADFAGRRCRDETGSRRPRRRVHRR